MYIFHIYIYIYGSFYFVLTKGSWHAWTRSVSVSWALYAAQMGLHVAVHMKLHMELHMELCKELQMEFIWRFIWSSMWSSI